MMSNGLSSAKGPLISCDAFHRNDVVLVTNEADSEAGQHSHIIGQPGGILTKQGNLFYSVARGDF